MPSGQYFYTNPQAAAVANNLSKIFFGDPEAEARRKQIEGIMLENQLKQQQIEENNTVNDARGSISRLFSTMDPNESAKLAPQFYSEFARIAGRDGFGANDGNVLLRGAIANMGGNDQSVARAFIGAGNGLGMNEGVSISDRNAIQGRNLQNNLDQEGMRQAGEDRRFTVKVDTDETAYTPGRDGGPYTAAPEAVANAFKIEGAKPGRTSAINDVSPAETAKLRALVRAAKDGVKQLSDAEQSMITARAAEYYQESRNAATAAQRAVEEFTTSEDVPGILWGSTPTVRMRSPEEIAAAQQFAPRPTDAETAAANGVVTPQTAGPKVSAAPTPISQAFGNKDQTTKTVAPKQTVGTRESPIPFDSVPEGQLKAGLFYMRNGAVREYLGGPIRDPSSWRGVKK